MESSNYYGRNGYQSYPSRDSSAYDWSLFEGRDVNYVGNRKLRERTEEKKNQKKSAAKAVGKKSKTALAVSQKERAYRIVFGLLLFIALGVMLSCCMQEHEIAHELDVANLQLTELRQDYEALNITFDNEMSSSALEEYATDVLGMQKRENSQTEWITIGGGDVFEYTEETGLGTWFQDETDRLLSYLD